MGKVLLTLMLIAMGGYFLGVLALFFFIMRENYRAWKQRREFEKKRNKRGG